LYSILSFSYNLSSLSKNTLAIIAKNLEFIGFIGSLPMDKSHFINFETNRTGELFELLIDLARYLRSPEGCPWDRKQTSLDFARYAKEECEEYIEAIEKKETEDINEEFGDALFILIASAVAGEAEGKMNILDALKCAHKKMLRRHEHVFGSKKAETEEEAWQSWHKVKEDEKKNKST